MTLSQVPAHLRCGRKASHKEMLASEDEQEGPHAFSYLITLESKLHLV